MNATLLTRLTALVAEWRKCEPAVRVTGFSHWLPYCADQLAEILADSPAEAESCICHSGSVCNEACTKGRCHTGCLGPAPSAEGLKANEDLRERLSRALAILATHHCAEGCEIERILEER